MAEPTDSKLLVSLSPGAFHALVEQTMRRVATEDFPQLAALVAIEGRVGQLSPSRTKIHYGVTLMGEDGLVCKADMTDQLVRSAEIRDGDVVRVLGQPTFRSSSYGVEVRVAVKRIWKARAAPAPSAPQSLSLSDLRALSPGRRSFPTHRPLSIALVHARSAKNQVVMDCGAELERCGAEVRVHSIPTSMQDPQGIADILERDESDVLMLIRGGGEAAEFELFEHPRLLKAMSAHRGYRIIGLGHSGNRTLLDLVVDHVARTPAQAGAHVREMIDLQSAAVSESPHVPQRASITWMVAAGVAVALVIGFLAGIVSGR